ncbi:hypothetical protein HPULCUR_001594 [Helicostylum pulchrum]|uniref:Uncharacterized protein n=1 Tax=Helicostylum pulchrum TaxID=562976 RepID=A0ABP9XN60_9FUNG
MSILPSLQADLKKATVKELIDCIRVINKKINPYQNLTHSGRKDEIVHRLVSFIEGLLTQNREETLITLVRIVNENAYKKLCWNYENGDIVINFVKPKRASSDNIESVEFVANPFLKPMKRLTAIKICPVAGQSRQSRAFSFTLTEEDRKLLATNNTVDDRPPYQIRFYCARFAGRMDKLEVEFPNICELKVNDSVIPGQNIRCLKGKPGTVNPPDLSVMSKKTAQNNLELIYINSSFPFIASVYIVERTPVQHLIDILKKERILSKEEVLRQLQEVQEDADIIMESETLSTKCPLAFTRIVTPIRSKSCNHLQCFDASTFLTMNEQTPTWSCPVCYRPIKSWEDLIVDEFFAQMLLNTPRHIDSVRVEPSGVVTIIDENPDLARREEEEEEEEEEVDTPHVKTEPEVTILLDDDDDDDVQVSYGSPYHATDTINIPIAVAPTPFEKPGPSCLIRKSPPTADSDNQPTRKRAKKKSDVIDLTLDSDEERSS